MKTKLAFITLVSVLLLSSCSERTAVPETITETSEVTETQTALHDHSAMTECRTEYATEFQMTVYADGCADIHINDGRDYFVVADGLDIPNGSEGKTVLLKPLDHVYLAATSAMDMIKKSGAADRITMTSVKADGWSDPEISEMISDGIIEYAGKYSVPDYERIISGECDLALESTMIYHTPEVREQLENSGIPVMIERSSYEKHPLGRLEWIRLYGYLFDASEKADEIFKSSAELVSNISSTDTEKTAAFFYITSNGHAVIHKPGDYVSAMIEIAGGKNIFTDEILGTDPSALSTMNIQFETFYSYACDADILIYNSTIDGGIGSIDEFIAKNSSLADLKAVKNGNVWCTGSNMFQQTTDIAQMIYEMNRIMNGENEDMEFFSKVE